MKVQIFRFFTAQVKIHQISHVTFQTRSEFFFKVWSTRQCHERQLFCTFLAETLNAIEKSSTSKWKFSDLSLVELKFTKFLMSFLKPRDSFSSNFTSLSRVMRHKSSALFHLKLYVLSTKLTDQVQIFRPSTTHININQILCHFSYPESVFA